MEARPGSPWAPPAAGRALPGETRAYLATQGILATGKPTAFRGTILDGTPTINLVRPVFGFDWYLGVAVPQTILNAPLTEMLWHMAGYINDRQAREYLACLRH